jgi:predicted GIY-YIG superfamily endonuclease
MAGHHSNMMLFIRDVDCGSRTSSESNALSERTRESNGLNMSASALADSFFVYIVRCSDDSFYVGHTSNVEDRINLHNEGRGAVWTACRRPVVLVYQEKCLSEERAVARERQLKRWTHAKKLSLINGDLGRLKSLAKRRIR